MTIRMEARGFFMSVVLKCRAIHAICNLLFPPTHPLWLSCRLQEAAPVMPALPSCPVQACRRPASRPPPTPRLRPRAGQHFALPPQAILACSRPPEGAPFSLRAIGGLALRSETASALWLIPARGSPYPARPRFTWTRPERG